MYKIHFELRGDKVYKRIILMILVIGFLSCNPASADNIITNGGFETGNYNGWSLYNYDTQMTYLVNSSYSYNSNYGLKMYAYGYGYAYGSIYQSIDWTDVDILTFDYNIVSRNVPAFQVRYGDVLAGTVLYSSTSISGWQHVELNVSQYSGIEDITFCSYGNSPDVWCYLDVYLDNIVAGAAEEPTYTTWSTWPEDSWAVGNYSMIVIGLPRPPDPVDFYIKTPSTDYIKKPLTKSPLVRTWNYNESQWYYQYFHTVYHSQYGDYSCKIVNSSADFIEYSNITVPYSSPDVPIPPVVTIPTPDPIEAPPEWNVTIPEPYENVTWIFDYTDFWDELGTTLNDTLYSTVGLIFIPMESINESVYTVYTHVDTAADMVSGSEHTNVIVQVAWNVIPDSIKTIFVGAAAIGLCIFILHRRT